MSLLTRLANVFRTGRLERDLDDEMLFHLEQRIERLVDGGMSRPEAAREAARRFGSRLRWREQSRDLKLVPWLDSVFRDARFAVRALRRNATVTGAAVASLSLALGACLAAFSLIDALVLRPLPVRDPERLVFLAFPTGDAERPEADTFNDPLFVRLREASRGSVDLFAMSTQVIRPAIFAGNEKEPVRTQYISGDAFQQLGVGASAGRTILSTDDGAPGVRPVAVLSHAFWQSRFGGDLSVIGRSVGIQDVRAREARQFEIVGVAASGFTGVEPGRPTDVWLPYAMYNARAFGNFEFSWFRILGRLRDGVPLERAQAVAGAAFAGVRRDRSERLADQTPEAVARYVNTPLRLRPAAAGVSPLRREFERPLWVLAAIAALVLLIAGSNVANLFLARTAARERELALRLSIGAGRGRLIQQVLIESALLASLATALAVLFASAAAPAVVTLLAVPDDPVRLDVALTWRLLLLAAVSALFTTALFGLVPALRASDVSPITAIQGGGRTVARAGLLRPFIALQVAFGLMVLFVGSLLVLSFSRLSGVNPGFSAANVLVLSLDTTERVDAARQRAAVLRAVDRLRSLPGLQAVSSGEFAALNRAWTHNLRVPGTPRGSIEATMTPVAPGYFETMKIPVLAGRGLTAADMAPGATSIVVSESFAVRYFGESAALGRVLDARFGDADAEGGHSIVGIVADTKYDLRKPAAPTIYVPLTARGSSSIVVRAEGDPAGIGARLREEVRNAEPLLRVTNVRTQAAIVGQTLLRERMLAMLAGFFAVVGVVLAAVGLYGVLSYAVVQRTREIGIRIALGARQLRVVRTVVEDTSRAVAAGAAAGLAGGLYASRFVTALLFEVEPLDFWSLALPVGILLTAGALAAVLPALRAARVDPVIALRHE